MPGTIPGILRLDVPAVRGLITPAIEKLGLDALACELGGREDETAPILEQLSADELGRLSIVLYNLEIKANAVKEQKRQGAR